MGCIKNEDLLFFGWDGMLLAKHRCIPSQKLFDCMTSNKILYYGWVGLVMFSCWNYTCCLRVSHCVLISYVNVGLCCNLCSHVFGRSKCYKFSKLFEFLGWILQSIFLRLIWGKIIQVKIESDSTTHDKKDQVYNF